MITVATLALINTFALLTLPTAAAADTGAYLDIATWPSIDAERTIGPEGVPQVWYGSSLEDNPVTVAQWALQHWSWWLVTAHRADLDAAMRGADWLLTHQQPDGTWRYEFNWSDSAQSMMAPWISGLAQGQAISMLVRAHEQTEDPRYLSAAKLALRPFSVSVDEGGVFSSWDGTAWYEEYPTPPLHVLNGLEFALVGLHDLAIYGDGDEQAQQLYQHGLDGLIEHIGLFDVPSAHTQVYGAIGASRELVVGRYPRAHALLTRYLATLSGSPTLSDFASRWEQYLTYTPPTPSPGSLAPSTVVAAEPSHPSCRLAGKPVRTWGRISCRRARHVIRRYLTSGHAPRRWRCHMRRRVVCRHGTVRVSVAKARERPKKSPGRP